MAKISLFSTLDIIAIAWFLIAALVYSWYAEHGPRKDKSLTAMMNIQREAWLRISLKRELRIVDTSIMSGLQNGTAFFASASLLAIGGCFALLRSSTEILASLENLPVDIPTNHAQWELKVFGLATIFAYAFFKFGWSFRLWNYASILLGAIPLAQESDSDAAEEALQRTLAMNRNAGRHFNRGMRTFFFSIGFIGWFVGPVYFILATTWIVLVLFRRQFFSLSLKAASYKLDRDDGK